MEPRTERLRPTLEELLPVVRWSETTNMFGRRRKQLVVLTRSHLMAAEASERFTIPDALYESDPRAALREVSRDLANPVDTPLDAIAVLRVTAGTMTDGFRRSRQAVKFSVERLDGNKVAPFTLPMFESLYLLDALTDLLDDRLAIDAKVVQAFEAREERMRARAEALHQANRAQAGIAAKPRPAAGLALCAAGLVLLLGWPALLALDNWMPFAAAVFLGVPLGAGLLGLGRRMRVPDYETAIARDPRQPVLYLRSFGSDDVAIPQRPPGMAGEVFLRLWNRAWFFSLPGDAVAWLIRLFYTLIGKRGDRFEEQLASAIRKTGPMIAIGRPGESVASGGAIRAYLSDDNWQAFVLDRIAHSRGVLLQIEATSGTWWEFAQCVQAIPIDRLVLLLTARMGSLQRYDEIRLLAARTLGLDLPRRLAGSAFILFDSLGVAQGYPIVWRPFWLAWLMPTHVNVGRSLAPVLAHLGRD